MNVVCTRYYRQAKKVLLPGEEYAAIFNPAYSCVDLYRNNKRIMRMTKSAFKRHFRIVGGEPRV